ncbi:MAG: hypothetical protein K6F04_01690 [bacterium]|nr:hypothetical protein [bacterium]
MKIIEKENVSYKNRNGRKKKSQRVNVAKYNKLLAELENLGVVSIAFDKNYSYKRRIQILEEIIKRQK